MPHLQQCTLPWVAYLSHEGWVPSAVTANIGLIVVGVRGFAPCVLDPDGDGDGVGARDGNVSADERGAKERGEDRQVVHRQVVHRHAEWVEGGCQEGREATLRRRPEELRKGAEWRANKLMGGVHATQRLSVINRAGGGRGVEVLGLSVAADLRAAP
eukprot:scaffold155_cov51-Phaeocystis_antarctica.AAC.4